MTDTLELVNPKIIDEYWFNNLSLKEKRDFAINELGMSILPISPTFDGVSFIYKGQNEQYKGPLFYINSKIPNNFEQTLLIKFEALEDYPLSLSEIKLIDIMNHNIIDFLIYSEDN